MNVSLLLYHLALDSVLDAAHPHALSLLVALECILLRLGQIHGGWLELATS